MEMQETLGKPANKSLWRRCKKARHPERTECLCKTDIHTHMADTWHVNPYGKMQFPSTQHNFKRMIHESLVIRSKPHGPARTGE